MPEYTIKREYIMLMFKSWVRHTCGGPHFESNPNRADNVSEKDFRFYLGLMNATYYTICP